MPNSFIITLKEPHLGWGEHRHTNTRDVIPGEGYIQIPRKYAERFDIFNSNHPTANPRYQCSAVNGAFEGVLLAQGSSTAGDVYAKQFSEEGNLKGIGDWYRSVNAQIGGQVRVTLTASNCCTIEYIETIK